MTFRTALTALAALSVTGISHNYDVDAVPDSIARAQLPALLVMPIDTQDDSLFREKGAGFQTVAFADGAKTVTYTTSHLLLVAPVIQSKGLRTVLPDLVDYIDNYFAALRADALLNNTLLEPAQVRVEPGIFKHGGVEYVGCAFRHRWLIAV
ncbi:MAG: hypothetical protein Q9P44_14030 [Anaerolineae bacterium]|nr:hypothetical protein [Anaerolineae bacterium]